MRKAFVRLAAAATVIVASLATGGLGYRWE